MSEKPESKSPTWMRVLLIGSIALNFIFVGLAGGAILKASNDGGPAQNLGRLGGPILSGFDQSHRSDLRKQFFSKRDTFRELRRGVGGADQELREALLAEPFDPEAFQEALNGRRDALALAVDEVNSMILDVVSRMSDEEREAVAEIMAERIKGFQRKDPFGEEN